MLTNLKFCTFLIISLEICFYKILSTVAEKLPKSCSEATQPYFRPYPNASIHLIKLDNGREPFFVCCYNGYNSENGAWTVILRRSSTEINFYRKWVPYREGFGRLTSDFWIGFEKLHALTTSTLHELIVLLEDFTGTRREARYSKFAIGDENELFSLKLLGEYTGNAGDGLSYHRYQNFSTFNSDNDASSRANCAKLHKGAWWYKKCYESNLCGVYYNKVVNKTGVVWKPFGGLYYNLKTVTMMIRPRK